MTRSSWRGIIAAVKNLLSVAFLCAFLSTVGFAQIPQSGDFYASPKRPLTASTASSVPDFPANATFADLKQDVAINRQEIRALELRVEELEREKAALEEKLNKDVSAGYVTQADLKLLETRLNDSVASRTQAVETSILSEVRAAAKSAKVSVEPAKPVSTPVPAYVSAQEKESYMKDGIRYIVQPGDTLSSIAKRNRSSVRAIMVVNELSTPDKIFVGKELFVPTL